MINEDKGIAEQENIKSRNATYMATNRMTMLEFRADVFISQVALSRNRLNNRAKNQFLQIL